MNDPAPPSDPLDDLVAECVRRRSVDGVLPLDELCEEHPQHAAALRRRIRLLEQPGPPRAAHRLRELIRRHRVAVAGIAAVLVTATIAQIVADFRTDATIERTRWTVTTTLRDAARRLRPPQQDLEDPAGDTFQDLGGGVFIATGATGYMKGPGAHVVGRAAADGLLDVLRDVVHESRFECLDAQETTLWQMLTTRFGELPESLLGRVRTHETTLAHQRDLNRWMLRAVTAPTAEDALEIR